MGFSLVLGRGSMPALAGVALTLKSSVCSLRGLLDLVLLLEAQVEAVASGSISPA